MRQVKQYKNKTLNKYVGSVMNKNIIQCAKNVGIKHNVSLRVIDSNSGKVVQSHTGHNAATNSMLTGIAYYLIGNGVLNQGTTMLSKYIPRFMSLGTMGLTSQNADESGLPILDEDACISYMAHVPGYGADGYDGSLNNNRNSFGLGPMFIDRSNKTTTINCELISDSFPRSAITYRDVIPETEAEMPETIDVVFSAMISTGALAQFRVPGNDYIFITEAGLWSSKLWNSGYDVGENSLLAAYRIVPPNSEDWDMSIAENREKLKHQILRVGKNQVVQIIWKIQLGAIEQLVGEDSGAGWDLYWKDVLEV